MLDLNIGYESNEALEFELFRKVILETALGDFKEKMFNLQYNDFFSIDLVPDLNLINKFRSMGRVFSTKPNSFIIATDISYVNVRTITRENKKILNCFIYAADENGIKETIDIIVSNFDIVEDNEASLNIRWYYRLSNERVDYTTIPETIGDVILQEAYPYINNLDSFVSKFLESTEPILVLVGTTGTGKTRLLRHVVRAICRKVRSSRKGRYDNSASSYINEYSVAPSFSYTNDAKIVNHDEIFVDFLGDGQVAGLILEDMDNSLKPRSEGNSIMSKFLGVSDGFITNYNKKILVTSNITNINTIDEAFLRPGRCFDVIKTRQLTASETVDLLKKLVPDSWENVVATSVDSKEEYSLAEIYKMIKANGLVRKQRFMGF